MDANVAGNVALDKAGRPTAVPPLSLETDEEKRRWAEAESRRKLRVEQIGRHVN